MTTYPFDLLAAVAKREHDIDRALAARPFKDWKDTLRESAELYEPTRELETAINTAIAVGMPLLLTGRSGTGKTQAAYYAALRLGLEAPLHYQVKSTSQGRDLLYTFDAVRYFRDAWARGTVGGAPAESAPSLNKWDYIEPGKLWQAIADKKRQPHSRVKVLLIDEIDKAPKDFPNDLLLELDELRFEVGEIEGDNEVKTDKALRPIVFITSNSERRLPEPFLRRCVYHHISYDRKFLERIVARRIREGQLKPLDAERDRDLCSQSETRFAEVRDRVRQKQPTTGEYLLWLHALVHRFGGDLVELRRRLEVPLKELDFLHLLIKDKDDWDLVQGVTSR